jgi:hypothetical protein
MESALAEADEIASLDGCCPDEAGELILAFRPLAEVPGMRPGNLYSPRQSAEGSSTPSCVSTFVAIVPLMFLCVCSRSHDAIVLRNPDRIPRSAVRTVCVHTQSYRDGHQVGRVPARILPG